MANTSGLIDGDGDGLPGGSRPAAPTLCRMVIVEYPGDVAPPPCAGVVAKVYDDGAINAHCFLPDGGMNFVTGLRHKVDIDALPEDDPGRNLPYYVWPKRA